MKRKSLILVVILLVAFMVFSAGCSSNGTSSAPASPQGAKSVPDGYPDKPVTFLVGYAAGGGSDITARSTIKMLNDNKLVTQSCVVENLPGASGVNAFAKMYKDPGDIYQILTVPEMGIPLCNGSLKATYDDFQPVAQIATETDCIAVRADSPFKTVDDVFAAIEKDPKSVKISVPGALDSVEPYRLYTIFEALKSKTVKMGSLNIVPMDGNAPVITSILGGDTDVTLIAASAPREQVKAGKMRILAVLSPQRLSMYPDAPTLVEKGINVIHNKARGYWMGKNVPKEIIQYWQDKLQKLTETADFKAYADKNNLQIEFKNGADYKKYCQDEGTAYGAFVKQIDANR